MNYIGVYVKKILFAIISQCIFLSLIVGCEEYLQLESESKSELLKAAIRHNSSEEVTGLCKENPELGFQQKNALPLIMEAFSLKSNAAGLALLEYCQTLIDFVDKDNNNLVMLAFKSVQNTLEMNEVIRKLVELSPASNLEKENNLSETSLSWALYVKNAVIAQAIIAKAPALQQKIMALPFNPHIKGRPLELARIVRVELKPISNNAEQPELVPEPILGPPADIPTKTEEETPMMPFIDNEYVSIKKEDEKFVVTIKKDVSAPVFINSDASNISDRDINEITFDKFADTKYLLLPKQHWFAQLFIANPFADQASQIWLTRPNMWGHFLKIIEQNDNCVLFYKGKVLKSLPMLSSLSQDQVDAIFGARKTLGKGGQGEVFAISYQGKEYALKQNAEEISDLEKLQFTKAVIEIYGAFQVGNQKYMLMQKGQKSLADMRENKELLSRALLRATIPRFLSLVTAQKKLSIRNSDIKPANMLVTADGIKVIDISSSYTKGYGGSIGNMLAQSLLEIATGKLFTGGAIKLRNFYDYYNDKNYRDLNVASPDYMSYWILQECAINKLHDNCSSIDTYDKLFELLDPQQLKNYGEILNKEYKDNSGTHDNETYGPYKTELPFPQLLQKNSINWQDYFNKKEQIGQVFCEKKLKIKKPFYSFSSKYSGFCNKESGQKVLTFIKSFTSIDEEFKEWIFDIYAPEVKLQTFRALASSHGFGYAFPYIFAAEFAGDKEDIRKGMLDLYNAIN
jgi:serine/threonine protein kinase